MKISTKNGTGLQKMSSLKERDNIFIEAIVVKKKTKADAYIDMLEFQGKNIDNKRTLSSVASRHYAKLQGSIEERKKSYAFEKQIIRAEKQIELIEKKEVIESNRELLNEITGEEECLKVAKNPVLFNTIVNLAVLKTLTSKIKLTEDEKQIKEVVFDYDSWEQLQHLKPILGGVSLNKDMFGAKVSKQVNKQLNIQVNTSNINK